MPVKEIFVRSCHVFFYLFLFFTPHIIYYIFPWTGLQDGHGGQHKSPQIGNAKEIESKGCQKTWPKKQHKGEALSGSFLFLRRHCGQGAACGVRKRGPQCLFMQVKKQAKGRPPYSRGADKLFICQLSSNQEKTASEQ